MRQQLRLFFIALQFLTRVPVPGWVCAAGFEPAWLNRSVRYFALVGALVGAVGALVAWVALQAWPPVVAATLALVSTLWLTVAFHEDGLADTCDALLGAAERSRALVIMKDSRIGTYGAAGLFCVLLLRVFLLAELLRLQPLLALWALVLAHAGGRACAVALMAGLPYAGDEAHAKAKPLARSVRASDAGLAVAMAAAVLAAALAWAPLPPALREGPLLLGVTSVASLGLLTLALRQWLQRRLGGYTGDTLGACEQLGEVCVLLVFVALGLP